MGKTSFDWNRLKVFHAVAEAGSFTAAGKKLHLSQSAVSRQVAALEDGFGLMLFQRHARGLVLTEAGRSLFEVANELKTRLSSTAALIRETKDSPSGHLHIVTTLGFGTLWLSSRLMEFQKLYPDIKIQLSIEDYGAELLQAKADVGIFPHPPDNPGLIQRQLLNYHFYLFASEEYLSSHGHPKNLEDLEKHRLLGYKSEGIYPYNQINWHLSAGRDDQPALQPSFESNNLIALAEAAQSGFGITYLPSYFINRFSKLIRVLPKVSGPVLPAYFIYPESLKNSKRIAVLKDFLIQTVKIDNKT